MTLSTHFVFPSVPLKCIHHQGKNLAWPMTFLLTQPKQSQKHSQFSYVQPKLVIENLILIQCFLSSPNSGLLQAGSLQWFFSLFISIIFLLLPIPCQTCQQFCTFSHNPAIPLLDIHQSELKSYVHIKFYTNVYRSIIHNQPKLETTQMTFNR